MKKGIEPETVTIPNAELTLDRLIGSVRQLELEARSKITQALLDEEMDERFVQLIQRLANKTPITDITDEEINVEVRAVRG